MVYEISVFCELQKNGNCRFLKCGLDCKYLVFINSSFQAGKNFKFLLLH